MERIVLSLFEEVKNVYDIQINVKLKQYVWLDSLSILAALTAVYSFLDHAKEDFQKLSRMHENMEKLYQNVMGYYAIDLKKISVEEFLTDLNNFRTMFMVQYVYFIPNVS